MIRLFSPRDLDDLLQIEQQSFPKSPYDWTTFINLHFLYPETFLVYVDETRGKKKGQILGYIIFAKEGHILSIAVHPLHRRKGIGKELIQQVMTTPRVQRVWAEVRRSNQGAQAFYFHLGFQVAGVVLNYYGNEDGLMVQWIPPDFKNEPMKPF
jgi:ribosomal-protein-alanine N-acetyltransferase